MRQKQYFCNILPIRVDTIHDEDLTQPKLAGKVFHCGEYNTLINSTAFTFRKGVFVPDKVTLEFIEHAQKISSSELIKTIADIGTGSGIIGIFIAKKYPLKKVYCLDTSKAATDLTGHNAAQNQIQNIIVLQNRKDRWIPDTLKGEVDFVISNPPYVGADDTKRKTFKEEFPDFEFQPREALLAGDNEGIRPYENLLADSKRILAKKIFLRCNRLKIKKIIALYESMGVNKIEQIQSVNNMSTFLLVNL